MRVNESVLVRNTPKICPAMAPQAAIPVQNYMKHNDLQGADRDPIFHGSSSYQHN
jgi:hypothetical protein